MIFEYQYDDNHYLIVLEPLDKATVKDGDEIFKIIHSEQENDLEEYEIKVFITDGENLVRQKVTQLSQDFQEILGAELDGAMATTFVSNPYFDDVMIFHGNTILTSKDRFIPTQCLQCGKRDLYEKKGKENKTDYIADVQAKLKSNPHPDWPFKGRLMVQFSVSDSQSRLNKIDLDNLAKAILDSMKGVVFEDDSQIVGFAADKECVKGIKAHIIAIRLLENNERTHYQDYIFSGRLDAWKEEYKQKRALGKSTRFTKY